MPKKKAAPKNGNGGRSAKRKPTKKAAAKKTTPRKTAKRKPTKKAKSAKRTPKKSSAKKAPAKRPSASASKTRGEYRRGHAAKQSRADSASAREIGACSKPENPKRRAAALADLHAFNLTYFPHRFPLEFSPDHLTVIRKMQAAIIEGGLFAQAMPRGSGKTTLTETGCIFALLTGRHDFIVLIGADKEAATDLLDSIKGEFEGNELLAADFPEVCEPIIALEGISNRCKGQTVEGVRTQITWNDKRITLPTVGGSTASGATIRCCGITGRIRGMKHRKANGANVRPTMFIADDPQTDEAAGSLTMTAKLERTLKGAVLGLSGPGQKMSGIMPCTVIRRNDLADRLLDVKQSPEWNGERCKMVYAMPERADLWEQYNEIRVAQLQEGHGLKKATAFYKKNKKAMDAGARVGWEARFNTDEISALQHAMNLRFADLYSFEAEYQNNPPDDSLLDDDDICTAEDIARKTNGYTRGLIPGEATKLVAFVDVQKKALYWVVLAVADNFTGWVVDYGAFPDQGVRHFALKSARRTLAHFAKSRGHAGAGLEGRITVGLTALIEEDILQRQYKRDTGGISRVELVGVDMGWEGNTVRSFIRNSPLGANIWPMKGVGVKAGDCPISEWRIKKGTTRGIEWNLYPPPSGQAVRHCQYDANFWKTFTHARFAMAPGDVGGFTIYKQTAAHHRILTDHMTAETPTKTSGRGREVIEWKLPPNKPDNHLFDCVSGACIVASMAGARLPEHAPRKVQRPERRRRSVNF